MMTKLTGVDDGISRRDPLKELEEKLMTYIEELHEKVKFLEGVIEELKYDKPVEGNAYIGSISPADRQYLKEMGIADEVFATDPDKSKTRRE